MSKSLSLSSRNHVSPQFNGISQCYESKLQFWNGPLQSSGPFQNCYSLWCLWCHHLMKCQSVRRNVISCPITLEKVKPRDSYGAKNTQGRRNTLRTIYSVFFKSLRRLLWKLTAFKWVFVAHLIKSASARRTTTATLQLQTKTQLLLNLTLKWRRIVLLVKLWQPILVTPAAAMIINC